IRSPTKWAETTWARKIKPSERRPLRHLHRSGRRGPRNAGAGHERNSRKRYSAVAAAPACLAHIPTQPDYKSDTLDQLALHDFAFDERPADFQCPSGPLLGTFRRQSLPSAI